MSCAQELLHLAFMVAVIKILLAWHYKDISQSASSQEKHCIVHGSTTLIDCLQLPAFQSKLSCMDTSQ